MSYFRDVLISIDQLGNTFAGGNPDNTISSRIGYHMHKPKNERSTLFYFWSAMCWIVDSTFYPVDGPEHCHNAFHNDAGERFDDHTKDWAVVVVCLIILVTCIPISIVLYSLWLFGVVSPKTIKRAEIINERLEIIGQKMHGICHEIDEFPISDPENIDKLKDSMRKMEPQYNDLKNKVLSIEVLSQ
ncbi:MAG: hypothetical protein ACFHU9_12000 [Fluviicola sp.]